MNSKRGRRRKSEQSESFNKSFLPGATVKLIRERPRKSKQSESLNKSLLTGGRHVERPRQQNVEVSTEDEQYFHTSENSTRRLRARKCQQRKSSSLHDNNDSQSSQEISDVYSEDEEYFPTTRRKIGRPRKDEKMMNTSEVYLKWIKKRTEFHSRGFRFTMKEQEHFLSELDQLYNSVSDAGKREIEVLRRSIRRSSSERKRKCGSRYGSNDFSKLYKEFDDIVLKMSKEDSFSKNNSCYQKTVQSPDLFSSASFEKENTMNDSTGGDKANQLAEIEKPCSKDELKKVNQLKHSEDRISQVNQLNFEKIHTANVSKFNEFEKNLNKAFYTIMSFENAKLPIDENSCNTDSISKFDINLLTNKNFVSSEDLQKNLRGINKSDCTQKFDVDLLANKNFVSSEDLENNLTEVNKTDCTQIFDRHESKLQNSLNATNQSACIETYVNNDSIKTQNCANNNCIKKQNDVKNNSNRRLSFDFIDIIDTEGYFTYDSISRQSYAMIDSTNGNVNKDHNHTEHNVRKGNHVDKYCMTIDKSKGAIKKVFNVESAVESSYNTPGSPNFNILKNVKSPNSADIENSNSITNVKSPNSPDIIENSDSMSALIGPIFFGFENVSETSEGNNVHSKRALERMMTDSKMRNDRNANNERSLEIMTDSPTMCNENVSIRSEGNIVHSTTALKGMPNLQKMCNDQNGNNKRLLESMTDLPQLCNVQNANNKRLLEPLKNLKRIPGLKNISLNDLDYNKTKYSDTEQNIEEDDNTQIINPESTLDKSKEERGCFHLGNVKNSFSYPKNASEIRVRPSFGSTHVAQNNSRNITLQNSLDETETLGMQSGFYNSKDETESLDIYTRVEESNKLETNLQLGENKTLTSTNLTSSQLKMNTSNREHLEKVIAVDAVPKIGEDETLNCTKRTNIISNMNTSNRELLEKTRAVDAVPKSNERQRGHLKINDLNSNTSENKGRILKTKSRSEIISSVSKMNETQNYALNTSRIAVLKSIVVQTTGTDASISKLYETQSGTCGISSILKADKPQSIVVNSTMKNNEVKLERSSNNSTPTIAAKSPPGLDSYRKDYTEIINTRDENDLAEIFLIKDEPMEIGEDCTNISDTSSFTDETTRLCEELFTLSIPDNNRKAMSEVSSVDFLNEAAVQLAELNTLEEKDRLNLVKTIDEKIKKFESGKVLNRFFFEVLSDFSKLANDSGVRMITSLMKVEKKDVNIGCVKEEGINPFFYDGSQELPEEVIEDNKDEVMSKEAFCEEMQKLDLSLRHQMEKYPHVFGRNKDGPVPDWETLFSNK